MPALMAMDIIPYTIHDSFICKDFEVESIVNTIKQQTMNAYGYSPHLHIDCISREEEIIPEPFSIDELFDN